MKRVFVTGAGGFVGGVLCAALRRCDPESEIVATGFGGSDALMLDLTDARAVADAIAAHRPDAVVHLAAQASVGALAAGAAERTWAVNLGGTLNLALAVARHAPEATLLFASSSEVYGLGFAQSPVDEETPLQPANAYARSKALAERVLAEALPATVKLVIARPFNHTGPGQREDFVLPSFAAQIARIEQGLQDPVMKVGNLDVWRDFLDVRDVVRAYVALLEAAPRLPAGFVCNVASGSARRLADVLATMRGLARVPFAIEVDASRLRKIDVPVASGRADRLKSATGWSPEVPIEETLASLLEDARGRVMVDRSHAPSSA